MLRRGDTPEGEETLGTEERRTARTNDPLVALSRCFESARRRAGLSALVLSDVSGLAIAGAGPASLCDELAARGAVQSAHPANDTVPCRMDVLLRTLEVRRLRIDGIEVLLCAEGPGQPGPDEADGSQAGSALDPIADEAAAGCQRILGRRRPGT